MASAKRRRGEFVGAREKLDPRTDGAEIERLDDLIRSEDDFIASFSEFLRQRHPRRGIVTFKGLMQLLLLALGMFILIGLVRRLIG